MRNVSKTWLFLALLVAAVSGQKSFAEFSSNFSNVGVQVGGIGVSVASGSTTSTPYYGAYPTQYPTTYPSYGYSGYPSYGGGGGCGTGCGSHGYVVVPVRPVCPPPPCMTGGCSGGGYYPYPVNSSFSSVRVAIGGGFFRGVRRPVFRPVMRRPVKKKAVHKPMPRYMPHY